MKAKQVIRDFERQLAKVHPSERMGFLDSFHAGLVHGRIYQFDHKSIEQLADFERRQGLETHADRLLSHPHYLGYGLFGAENFAQFLKGVVGEDLIVKGPKVTDFSYDRDYTKVWEV